MPAGIITTWCERTKTEVEKRGERGVGGKSANPLTGFRCSCRNRWPVGGVKATRCDMANLGPQAAQELGPVEATDGGISTSGNHQDRGR